MSAETVARHNPDDDSAALGLYIVPAEDPYAAMRSALEDSAGHVRSYRTEDVHPDGSPRFFTAIEWAARQMTNIAAARQ